MNGFCIGKWDYNTYINGVVSPHLQLVFCGPHFANHQKNNSPTFNNHETRLRPLRVPSSPPPWSPRIRILRRPNAARFSMASEMAPRERGATQERCQNAASVRRSRALFLSYKFIGIYRDLQGETTPFTRDIACYSPSGPFIWIFFPSDFVKNEMFNPDICQVSQYNWSIAKLYKESLLTFTGFRRLRSHVTKNSGDRICQVSHLSSLCAAFGQNLVHLSFHVGIL